MATAKQDLGEWGERLVTKNCSCPKCKRVNTLRRLPTNFKCADLVCDFCGYLAQVKTKRVENPNALPDRLLGGAWSVQDERMKAGIFFPLFAVLQKDTKTYSIFYLPADLQQPEMFVPRRPLSPRAKRSGWQGFYHDLTGCKERFVRLV